MNKWIMILVIAMAATSSVSASAEQLSDGELSGIYAGEFNGSINGIAAVDSSVVDQTNMAIIDSISGSISDSAIDNSNLATVTNTGNSAVALQANVAVLAGIGSGAPDNSANSIVNTNDATVDNLIDTTLEGSVSGSSVQGTTSIGDLDLNGMSANLSAVASQVNIGAIAGDSSVVGSSISNVNTASVVQ